MRYVALCVTASLAVSSCATPRYSASAFLENGVTVTMTLSPMFSLQSDWHRKLTVSYNGETIETELASDTGWWRGSNLYRHTSGSYILNEGQAGCTIFSTTPLAFNTITQVGCELAPKNSSDMESLLKHYVDLEFLGVFDETRDNIETRVNFLGVQQAPERKLQKPL